MFYTETNTACGEMTRSAFGPAGPGGDPGATDTCDSFDDLLAGSSFNTPGNPGAPESAHILLDQMWQQSTLEDVAPEGDVDDALIHLIDRAAQVSPSATWADQFGNDRYHGLGTCHSILFDISGSSRPLPRPTWVYPLTDDRCVIDRAGAQVIALRHLSPGISRQVVSFVEYGDPQTAQAVVADLIETNVFAAIRPEVATHLVMLVFDRRTTSQAILSACEQAITASGLFNDLELSQFAEKKGGDAYDQFENHIAIPFPAKAAASSPRAPASTLERKPTRLLALYRKLPFPPPPFASVEAGVSRSAAVLPSGRRDQGPRTHESALWRLTPGQLYFQVASQNRRERDRTRGWFTPIWSLFAHLLVMIRSWKPTRPFDTKILTHTRAWTVTASSLLISAMSAALATALALMLASAK
jgi:hypothetical protein